MIRFLIGAAGSLLQRLQSGSIVTSLVFVFLGLSLLADDATLIHLNNSFILFLLRPLSIQWLCPNSLSAQWLQLTPLTLFCFLDGFSALGCTVLIAKASPSKRQFSLSIAQEAALKLLVMTLTKLLLRWGGFYLLWLSQGTFVLSLALACIVGSWLIDLGLFPFQMGGLEAAQAGLGASLFIFAQAALAAGLGIVVLRDHFIASTLTHLLISKICLLFLVGSFITSVLSAKQYALRRQVVYWGYLSLYSFLAVAYLGGFTDAGVLLYILFIISITCSVSVIFVAWSAGAWGKEGPVLGSLKKLPSFAALSLKIAIVLQLLVLCSLFLFWGDLSIWACLGGMIILFSVLIVFFSAGTTFFYSSRPSLVS